jgi:uncharacterized integral membrane protein
VISKVLDVGVPDPQAGVVGPGVLDLEAAAAAALARKRVLLVGRIISLVQIHMYMTPVKCALQVRLGVWTLV